MKRTHYSQRVHNAVKINALLAKIVIQAYMDLQLLVNKPDAAKKETKKCLDFNQLISFWNYHAEDILAYLIGKNKASIFVKKIEPLLEKAKKHVYIKENER